MNVQHNLVIDLLRPEPNVIHVTQDDSTHIILLSLRAGGQTYHVEEGLTSGESVIGVIAYMRADGISGEYDEVRSDDAVAKVGADDSKWQCLIDGIVFAAPGFARATVRFMTATGKYLHAFPIDFDVAASGSGITNPASHPEMTTLGQLAAEVANCVHYTAESKTPAEKQQARQNMAAYGSGDSMLAGSLQLQIQGSGAHNSVFLDTSDSVADTLFLAGNGHSGNVKIRNVDTPENDNDAVPKIYVDGLMFDVTVHADTDEDTGALYNISSDKTFAQIYAAYAAGKIIRCIFVGRGIYILPIVTVSEAMIVFAVNYNFSQNHHVSVDIDFLSVGGYESISGTWIYE